MTDSLEAAPFIPHGRPDPKRIVAHGLKISSGQIRCPDSIAYLENIAKTDSNEAAHVMIGLYTSACEQKRLAEQSSEAARLIVHQDEVIKNDRKGIIKWASLLTFGGGGLLLSPLYYDLWLHRSAKKVELRN